MIVEKSQATFNLFPSKVFRGAQLGLSTVVIILLLGLPIFWWAKVLEVLVTALTTVHWCAQWQALQPEILRSLDSERWTVADMDLQLQPRQFVTRHQVILYFKTTDETAVSRVLPADAMPVGQHRLLRRLLIAR